MYFEHTGRQFAGTTFAGMTSFCYRCNGKMSSLIRVVILIRTSLIRSRLLFILPCYFFFAGLDDLGGCLRTKLPSKKHLISRCEPQPCSSMVTVLPEKRKLSSH